MSSPGSSVAALHGRDLCQRTVSYDERDAALYALAVGAAATELSLIYERDLRVLPTFALTLGLWAVWDTHALGAYDPNTPLHISQHLEMTEPLPPSGTVAMRAQITRVWDKGSAVVIEVEVRAREFRAVYGIYVPAVGGWGGERGPTRVRAERPAEPEVSSLIPSCATQAALYRLTGDRHRIHIDPEVAAANGFARPILHGLCTLGMAALGLARAIGEHPADLRELSAAFTAPVLPGDCLLLRAWRDADAWAFDAAVGGAGVLSNGRARFANQ